ncbi:MAG: hypothetical protein OCD00_00750 [Colwellia sp.]
MKTFISFILFSILLTGCTNTSSNDYNYHKKYSSSSRLIAKLVDSVDNEVSISNDMFGSNGYKEHSKEYYQNLGATPYGSAFIETPKITTNIVVTEKQLLLDLKLYNVKKIKYRLGEYLIDPLTGSLDPQTSIFIDTVKRIVKKFDAQIKNSGHNVIINAVYTGGADNKGLRRPIPFSNQEIGSINETVTVNDKRKENVTINNDSYIRTNTQLATVRAVAVSKAVDFKVAPIKLNNSFKVELSNDVGDEYRFVRLQLQIVEAK